MQLRQRLLFCLESWGLWVHSGSKRLPKPVAPTSKLRALGQLELGGRPSAAIAYAIASLELNDDPEVRRFALEALWKGPTELWISDERFLALDFSDDGKWFAASNADNGQAKVFSLTGGDPLVIKSKGELLHFSPQSDFLVSAGMRLEKDIDVWSVPGGRHLNRIKRRNPNELVQAYFTTTDGRMIVLTRTDDWVFLYSISDSWDKLLPLGRIPVLKIRGRPHAFGYDVDASGTLFAYADDKSVYVVPLNNLEKGERVQIGGHDNPIWSVTFDPEGDRLASVDVLGEIRLWARTHDRGAPLRIIETGDESLVRVRFDRTGSKLLTQINRTGVAAIWDLTGPPDADPLLLHRQPGGWIASGEFHPDGNWAASGRYGAVIYPLARRYPKILRGHRGRIDGLVIAQDGSWIASSSLGGSLIQWPLSPEAGVRRRVLFESERLGGLDADPEGHFIIVAGALNASIISLNDGSARELGGFEVPAHKVAVGPRGKLIANVANRPDSRIGVRNLDTGESKVLDAGHQQRIVVLKFTPEGHLLTATGSGDLRLWNIDEGTSQLLLEKSARIFDMAPDGRTLVAAVDGKAAIYDLEDGSHGN